MQSQVETGRTREGLWQEFRNLIGAPSVPDSLVVCHKQIIAPFTLIASKSDLLQLPTTLVTSNTNGWLIFELRLILEGRQVLKLVMQREVGTTLLYHEQVPGQRLAEAEYTIGEKYNFKIGDGPYRPVTFTDLVAEYSELLGMCVRYATPSYIRETP